MRLSAATLVLTMAAAAPCALAAPRSLEADVDRLSNEAVAAYRRGDYARSVALLEEAYHLHADPVLLYNMAKAEEMRGNRVEARARYRAFLGAPTGDAKLKAKSRAALKRLEEAPPPAPAPEAKTTDATPPGAAPPAATLAPAPAATLTPAPPPPLRPRATFHLSPRHEWIGGAILAAVGVGAIGGGAALYADVLALHDQFATAADDPTGTNEGPKRDLASRAAARSAASTALYVIGGIFVAGGGALVAHGLLRERRERPHAMLMPIIGGTEVGICVRQSF